MSVVQKICETPFCGRVSKRGNFCNTCKKRKARLSNPCTSLYHDKKNRARQKGIEWGITLEEWKKWWEDHPEYEALRGRGANDLTIDRKEEEYGYFLWNFQLLTNSENVKKHQRWRAKRKGWSTAMKKEADDPF